MNGIDGKQSGDGMRNQCMHTHTQHKYLHFFSLHFLGGPMWRRFWDSFGAVEDNSSQLSDNSSQIRSHISNTISPQPSTSLSQLKSYSDISPDESASMVNVDVSSTTLGPSAMEDPHTFSFKFTTPGQKTHRVVCRPIFNELLEAVRVKMVPEHGDDVGEEEWLSIAYLDDEDDNVLISCDADVADAIHLARKVGQTRVKLIVQDSKLSLDAFSSNPHSLATISASDNEVEAVAAAEATKTPTRAPTTAATSTKSTKKSSSQKKKSVAAAPQNNLVLAAAVGFLGVVIAGVFIYSRVQQQSSISSSK